MHFSKALMRVSDSTMSMCSDALEAAFKSNRAQVVTAVNSFALRDGMVMRVKFEVEIVKPEDS